MISSISTLFFSFAAALGMSCAAPSSDQPVSDAVNFSEESASQEVNTKTGADQSDQWLPKLQGKRIGLVVNQTSVTGEDHLVDVMLANDLDVISIFAPEHGFRGKADAGEKVKDGKDAKTGLPLLSLYGKNKRPSQAQMELIDILVFDIQDVGVRFYTYISTMHECMEACADSGTEFLVLDRPNPNGHYIDGPLLKKEFRSFVGMHPIPVVHGLTVGELARMIVGEGWLKSKEKLSFQIVPVSGWNHSQVYELPVNPSPNLPNQRSIYLYPSLCFFEGTIVSVGRGTDMPFQVIGHPDIHHSNIDFIPAPNEGAKHPKLEGQLCHGTDLRLTPIDDQRTKKQIDLSLLIAYHGFLSPSHEFFLSNHFIDKLAGTEELRLQIEAGKTEAEIRGSWKEDLDNYRLMREKYLLYP